jgi:hypothetical protein
MFNFLMQKVVYSIFVTEYSTDFSAWPVETKWHNGIMKFDYNYSTFVLSQMLVDGG